MRRRLGPRVYSRNDSHFRSHVQRTWLRRNARNSGRKREPMHDLLLFIRKAYNAQARSRQCNAAIRLNTVRLAMVGQLRCPAEGRGVCSGIEGLSFFST